MKSWNCFRKEANKTLAGFAPWREIIQLLISNQLGKSIPLTG
jgi:hypothetical protein